VTALLAPLLLAAVPHTAAAAAPTVAVVVRTLPPPRADTFYAAHLKQRGWKVTLVDDDRIRSSGQRAIAGYDLVVISSSVYPARIANRLLNAPEPIIVAEHRLFGSFGLTGARANRSGQTSARKAVNIVKPNSPLAANLRGAVTVATRAEPMNFGIVGPGADVIASQPGNPSRAMIFSYDVGDTLASGGTAKGRRVGFFMSQILPNVVNRDGWDLFDAAAAWLTPAAPDPAVELTFDPVVPDEGALLGANVSPRNFGNRYKAVLGFQNRIGRDIAIINRFHEFSAGLYSSFFWDRKHIQDGRTVMISWRATDNAGERKGAPDPDRAKKIVAGRFDREIDAMATAVRDLQSPVLLRFNWEMDQVRGDPQYIGSPAEFIAAWRYVHRRFQQRGVTNVEWVWAPRARSFSKGIGQTFYPGYDFVDWIGGSAVPINSYSEVEAIFGAWNQWATNIGKPQLLWVGLRENPADSLWKANFFKRLRMLATGPWVNLKALVYYDSKSPLGNDYFADTSIQSLSAFRKLACDPHFTVSDSC